jgi:hypothetical protein
MSAELTLPDPNRQSPAAILQDFARHRCDERLLQPERLNRLDPASPQCWHSTGNNQSK